jgi:hypothetical protein
MAWGQTANITQNYINNYLGSRIQNITAQLEDLHDVYTDWYLVGGITSITGVATGQGGFNASDGNTIASFLTDWGNGLYNLLNGDCASSGNAYSVGVPSYNFMQFAKPGLGLAPHG